MRAIFAAVNREQASPEERRLALVRAGVVASAYQGDSLVDTVFASASDSFLHQNGDLNLGRGRSTNA